MKEENFNVDGGVFMMDPVASIRSSSGSVSETSEDLNTAGTEDSTGRGGRRRGEGERGGDRRGEEGRVKRGGEGGREGERGEERGKKIGEERVV
jgi:hypothetical protein